eukprot:COSAG01_NODE_50842_length_360_cov_0.371648_1_plen_58_part_10
MSRVFLVKKTKNKKHHVDSRVVPYRVLNFCSTAESGSDPPVLSTFFFKIEYVYFFLKK